MATQLQVSPATLHQQAVPKTAWRFLWFVVFTCFVVGGIFYFLDSSDDGQTSVSTTKTADLPRPVQIIRFQLPVGKDTLTVQNWDSMTGARISWELEGNNPFSMTTAVTSTGKWKTYEIPASVKVYWHGGPLGPAERGHLVLWAADSGTVVIAREYRAKK